LPRSLIYSRHLSRTDGNRIGPSRGIHRELIERGILRPEECCLVLGLYVGRPMYQRALAAGGARINLAGNPTDEVTAEEIAQATASVTRHEARAIAKTETARAIRQAAYAERIRAKQALVPSPSESTAPQRDGLADLKRAAAERRNGGAL
jgi:sRNA-binding protein